MGLAEYVNYGEFRLKVLYRDILRLETPVGHFSIQSPNGPVHFNVIESIFDIPYEVKDRNGNSLGIIDTPTKYEIVLESDTLALDTEYSIRFSNGSWGYADSDEFQDSAEATINGWVIGIGAIDPNRKEKEHQAQRYADSIGQHMWPAQFDESRFERYSVDMADDYNGYLFKLYDKQVEHIGFFVAWVKIEGYKPIEYRRALGNWIG